MRLLSICLLLLFTALQARAMQDTCHAADGMMKVFIEPIDLVDVMSDGSLRLGVEAPLGYATSVIATGGYYWGNGYYLKGGIKRYETTAKTRNWYLELSAFYKNHFYDADDNIRLFDSTGKPQPGNSFSYGMAKWVYGFHVEMGQVSVRRHWVYEWYFGAGVRVKTARASISRETQGGLYHYHESFIEYFNDYQEERAIYPSLTLGIRLGYAFGKKCNPHKKA